VIDDPPPNPTALLRPGALKLRVRCGIAAARRMGGLAFLGHSNAGSKKRWREVGNAQESS
jgi:hypothetical protein